MEPEHQLFARPCVPTEILYRSLQKAFGSADHQFLFEGTGLLESVALAEAARQASAVTWEARVVLQGEVWVERLPEVPVRVCEEFDFQGQTDPTRNPLEILLSIDGARVVFRIFHGVMDAQGALMWIGNVFRVLQGSPPIPTQTGWSDLEFLRGLGSAKGRRLRFHAVNPGCISDKAREEYLFFSFPGRLSQLGPHLMASISEVFCRRESLFLVPVSLRRHRPEVTSAANLSLPLFIDGTPGTAPPQFFGRLVLGLKRRAELNLGNARLSFLRHVPRWALVPMLRFLAFVQRRFGVFAITGVLTMLGQVDLASFVTNGWSPQRLIVLPLRNPLVAVSLVAVETANETQIVLSAGAGLDETQKKQLRERWQRMLHARPS